MQLKHVIDHAIRQHEGGQVTRRQLVRMIVGVLTATNATAQTQKGLFTA
jgi:hypothetical protein